MKVSAGAESDGDNESVCVRRLANWFQDDGAYVLCGNASGSRKCPPGFVCWKDRGLK
jgi:hypothetical protein